MAGAWWARPAAGGAVPGAGTADQAGPASRPGPAAGGAGGECISELAVLRQLPELFEVPEGVNYEVGAARVVVHAYRAQAAESSDRQVRQDRTGAPVHVRGDESHAARVDGEDAGCLPSP